MTACVSTNSLLLQVHQCRLCVLEPLTLHHLVQCPPYSTDADAVDDEHEKNGEGEVGVDQVSMVREQSLAAQKVIEMGHDTRQCNRNYVILSIAVSSIYTLCIPIVTQYVTIILNIWARHAV